MRQVQPDVWETEVEHPFPGLTTHAYLWLRPQGNVLFYNTGRRYLFTGDTLYLGKGDSWTAGYIAGHSDKTALAKSLELLKTFKPDVVFSSAFTGKNGYQEMSPDEWPAHVDAALATLRKK